MQVLTRQRIVKTTDVRKLTVSSCDAGGLSRPVPFIRIRARYLEDAGFEEGTRMKVTVGPGRIVLEALTNEGERVCEKGVPPMLVRMLMKRMQEEQIRREGMDPCRDQK